MVVGDVNEGGGGTTVTGDISEEKLNYRRK